MSLGSAKPKDAAEPMNPRIASIRTQAETILAEQFARKREGAREPVELAAWRAARFAEFLESGFPTRRREAWHYTDLRRAISEALPQADPEAARGEAGPISAPIHPGAHRLVMVDGVFRPDLSDVVEGVSVRCLAAALRQDAGALTEALEPPGLGRDPTLALNAAFMDRGVLIEAKAGARIDKPIEISWMGANLRPQAIFARSFVRLGAGARLNLVESIGEPGGARQVNSVMVVRLEEDARLEHVLLGAPQPGCQRVETFLATLARGAGLSSCAFVAGSPFLRRQVFLRFEGENGQALLSGLSLLRGDEHADNTLLIEHVAPHCESRERFKHVIEGEATGVFQGKIVVAPGAQKTDGQMKSRAILLSEGASMYNKPELEIFADDVVCGHGATCGDLDEDQLFYAMARGLPRPQAEALLLEAFAQETFEGVTDEGMRETLGEGVRAWLAQRGS